MPIKKINCLKFVQLLALCRRIKIYSSSARFRPRFKSYSLYQCGLVNLWADSMNTYLLFYINKNVDKF